MPRVHRSAPTASVHPCSPPRGTDSPTGSPAHGRATTPPRSSSSVSGPRPEGPARGGPDGEDTPTKAEPPPLPSRPVRLPRQPAPQRRGWADVAERHLSTVLALAGATVALIAPWVWLMAVAGFCLAVGAIRSLVADERPLGPGIVALPARAARRLSAACLRPGSLAWLPVITARTVLAAILLPGVVAGAAWLADHGAEGVFAAVRLRGVAVGVPGRRRGALPDDAGRCRGRSRSTGGAGAPERGAVVGWRRRRPRRRRRSRWRWSWWWPVPACRVARSREPTAWAGRRHACGPRSTTCATRSSTPSSGRRGRA